MKAVILAAGEGLRCRPLTFTRSKVMLPVANKPILEHVIHSLSENGIKDIILIVGYEKERIMDFFEDGINFGVSIQYIEQRSQLGTAHAIKQAARFIEPDEGEFLVVNGDNIIEPRTISNLLDKRGGDATLLTFKMEKATGYGVVVAEGNRVKTIVEKTRMDISHLVNTGIYIFKPEIFERIEQTPISDIGEYAITDTLQTMIDDGLNVTMVPTRHKWLDAIHAWDLLKANSIALEQCEKSTLKGAIENNAVLVGSVTVGKNSTIRSGCYIVGPVVIGENCEIGPNTVILSSTSIGNNVNIGPFTHVQNSIIMNESRIGPHGYISNTVIGSNNTIGPYFVTEQKENLEIGMKGKLHHVDKLGTVIGDDNTIDHMVLVKAGNMIATNCRIGSKNVVSQELPRNSIVI
ncbi:MAG: NTP transferase domain-containing protein [Methanosarcinaceae archaeon]|nr:NTP transferase domain-containing protein [Methanosarcinaceae archaeon]